METLNELYNKSCKPKCESYKQISSHLTLIDNFFEDFDKARDFFVNREKWRCIQYQNYDLSGCTSLFPFWIGRSLMEKYVSDNKISDNAHSYQIECNFRYDDKHPWSISNSNHFPHIDGVENNNIIGNVCLINLNKVPVSTNFYTYKNKEYCTNEMRNEWIEYNKQLTIKLKEYYNRDSITRDEVKSFLDNQKLDIKLIKTLEYNPNQAIVYSQNLFHSANVTKEFTEDNPRALLTIAFDRKIYKNKNINYG